MVELQPEGRDAWVVDAEKWIAQIKGVMQCKVDLDADGEVSGVHVIARSDREPRHIVRDVEGLLKARLGISVYYKKIGVVQVVETDPPTTTIPDAEPAVSVPLEAPTELPGESPAKVAAEATKQIESPDFGSDDREAEVAREAVLLAEEFAPRLLCNGVGVMSSRGQVRAEVDLQAAGLEAAGVAEGSNRHGGDLQMVATATLDAVEALVEEPIGLNLLELRHERFGREHVVLVAVELVLDRRAEILYGTCQPGPNLYQAVVFAVLDALNRRLEMMLFKGTENADN